MTLLYVDDDPEDCLLFCEAVQKTDPSLTCITASGGRDALRILNLKETIDIIFLDYRMNDMDGGSVLKEIVKLKRIPPPKILMYSTFMNKKQKEECRESGAYDCIQKPGSFKDICELIRKVVAEPA
jgi:CheY-like chemotaxis protein